MLGNTRYEYLVELLLNQWIFVVIVLVVLVLGVVPQIRDGITTIVQLIPKKKKNPRTDEEVEMQGELIRFEEKMLSLDHDVVKIICHTHRFGVAAERIWIGRKYPGAEVEKQTLTTLDLLTVGKDGPDKVFFDVVDIELTDGRYKKVYFDISDFFTCAGTSNSPSDFMGEKLRRLYT